MLWNKEINYTVVHEQQDVKLHKRTVLNKTIWIKWKLEVPHAKNVRS